MKKEEKQMICEWLDKYANGSHLSLLQFKKDNNLIVEDKMNMWLRHSSSAVWLGFFCTKTDRMYGINVLGEWFNLRFYNFFPNSDQYIIASNSEIEERLTKCAIKMGYDKRQSECLIDVVKKIDFSDVTFELDVDSCILWVVDETGNNNCIMKNGTWAKFIPTEKERLIAERDALNEKISKL